MGSETQFQAIFESLYKFAHNTPDRVALSDWYDTVKGTQTGFQARPVVGGLYARSVLLRA